MPDILLYIYYCIIVSALLSGIAYWSHFNSLFKTVLLQIVCVVLTEIVGRAYHFLSLSSNNTRVYNYYLIVDLWLMGTVAFQLVRQSLFRRFTIAGLMACIVVDITCFVRMGVDTFANWGFLSASTLFTLVFLLIFIRQLSNNQSSLFMKQPEFWLCTGILIYYGCSVPLFGLLNYLIKYHPAIAAEAFGINNILNIIRYSLISVAFYYQRKQNIQSKVIAR